MFIKIKKTIYQISKTSNKKKRLISLDEIKDFDINQLHFEKGQYLFNKKTQQIECIIDIRISKTLGIMGSSFLTSCRKQSDKGIKCNQWWTFDDLRSKYYLISSFDIGDKIITSQLKFGYITIKMLFSEKNFLYSSRETYGIRYYQNYRNKHNIEFLKDYLSNSKFRLIKYNNHLDYYWKDGYDIFLLDWTDRLIDISKKSNGFKIIEKDEWLKYTQKRLSDKISIDNEKK